MSLQEDAKVIREEYLAAPGPCAMSEAEAVTLARRLRAISRDLDKLQTAECNRPLSAAEQALLDRLPMEAHKVASDWGLKLYHNGDPRGRSLGVICEHTRRYNTMGGVEAGWRVGA